MRHLNRITLIVATALIAGCHAEVVPDNQSVMMCVAQKDWPALIATMDRFGRANELKLIGGIEEGDDGKPMLNVALAQGYNYYFGDDLDLWIVSDPVSPNIISYGAVGKHNPINHRQWELTRSLLRAIQPLASMAKGTREEPQCPQIETTQTPR
jgi:hypothetical protein